MWPISLITSFIIGILISMYGIFSKHAGIITGGVTVAVLPNAIFSSFVAGFGGNDVKLARKIQIGSLISIVMTLIVSLIYFGRL